jgi:hypothetical protein
MSHGLQRGRFGWALCFALALLPGCSENEAPDEELHPVKALDIARIMPAKEALAGAHVPTLDPATMHEADIRKALKTGPRCDFRYTTNGKPVLAISHSGETAGSAVVKLNGQLVMLTPGSTGGSGEQFTPLVMVADPVRVTVNPEQREEVGDRANVRRREANMIFEIAQSLRVGYRGYLDCTPEPPTLSPRRMHR